MPPFLKDKWPFFAFGGLVLLLMVAVFISKMERPFGVAGNMLTQLTAMTTPTSDDLIYVMDDPGGTPADRKLTYANLKSTIESGLTITESQTLAQVTALGATATATVSLTGGLLASSSTVTGALTVVGATTLATTTVMGKGVCLSDGTYCAATAGGGGSDINWTWSEAGGFVRQTTSSNDLILGSTATTTGAPIYLDPSGATIGTSTLTIGHSTNVNVVIGGTSSTQTAAGSSLFVMNGDDLWVKGNIGSATTVYAAGGFMTGGTKHDGVGTRGVVGNMELSFSGSLLVKNVNDLTRIIVIDPLTGNIYPSGLTSSGLGLVNSPFGKIYTSSTWTTSGNIVTGANGEMQIGSATRSIATIHASGTSQLAYVSTTWLTVGGQAVCLANGTNCPASSSNANFWTYDGNADFLSPVTSTTAVSSSNFIVFQDSNNQSNLDVSGFSIRVAGVETTISDAGVITAGDVVVGGQSVCLANGTNCPASTETDTLLSVSNRGASATATLQLYGGFLAASSTVTSSLYVVGSTTLTNATATTLFTTSLKGTSSTITTIAATDLFSAGATSTALFATSFKATSSTIATLAAGTFFYGNATGTNLFATVASSTNLFSSMATLGGLVVSSTTVCLTNGVGCPSSYSALTITNLTGTNITTPTGSPTSTFMLDLGSIRPGLTAPVPTSSVAYPNDIPSATMAMNATNTNCGYTNLGYLGPRWDAGRFRPILSWMAPTGTVGNVVFRVAAQSYTSGTHMGLPFTQNFSYVTSTVTGGYNLQVDTMDWLTVTNASSTGWLKLQVCRIGGQAGDTFGADVYPLNAVVEYAYTKFSDR